MRVRGASAVHWVSFDVGGAGAIALLRRHALFAGLSTGASFAAAEWERRATPPAKGAATVILCPDTGNRYRDSVFARHADFEPLDSLAPSVVGELAELRLPWSTMEWAGAGDPQP